MSENVAAYDAATAQSISSEFGSCAFWRLHRGSKQITLTYPNGRETTGVQVRRNGKVWTVDVVTTCPHDDSAALRVVAWKRQMPCDLYVLMRHVNYDAYHREPDTTQPRLQFLGVATADMVFGHGADAATEDDSVVPLERLLTLGEAIAHAEQQDQSQRLRV
jgi:hypothetical protein